MVEDCQGVSIKGLLDQYKVALKTQTLSANIGSQDISLTTSKAGISGIRYWFSCPLCQRRVGIIYVHPITNQVGCRHCLGLDYRSRRYKGMVENNLNDKVTVV